MTDASAPGDPRASLRRLVFRACAMAAAVIVGAALVVVLARNDAFDVIGAKPSLVDAIPGASVSAELGQVRVLEDAHIDDIRAVDVSGEALVELRVHLFRGADRTGIFLNGGCSTEGLPPRAEGSKRAADLDVRRGDVLRIAAIVTPSAPGMPIVDRFEIRYRQGISGAQSQTSSGGAVRVRVAGPGDGVVTTCR